MAPRTPGRVSPDPCGIVAQLYADFDYPEELQPLVRWYPRDPMPHGASPAD
jgi:hypothetical protein